MRSKDTEITAVKISRSLRGGESTLKSGTLDTKVLLIEHGSPYISSLYCS